MNNALDETPNSDWLASGFLRSAAAFPDAPALSIAGAEISYGDLLDRVMSIASACESTAVGDNRLTAILATHSATAYAGILGTLFAGNGYVPLNPKMPAHRLNFMLGHSGCTSVIIDREREALVKDVIQDFKGLTLIFADRHDVSDLARTYPDHKVLGVPAVAPPLKPSVPPVTDPAYILYTSGSTGAPKGVAVSHANVAHFLSVAEHRLDLSANDRFTHLFDLSFDLSVFDMFMTWKVGGCMCVPTEEDRALPVEYITRERITVWFSVPSLATLMDRLRQLEPGRFPNIRVSLFCGEALLTETARAWRAATPNAPLHNIYGPTEVTLACTWYAFDDQADHGDIVPIGAPFDGMTALVANSDFSEVAPGAEGELLMSGPQVAIGYWRDPELTAGAFVTHPESDALYYRTGDLVTRPAAAHEPIQYVGRRDHQVKIRGFRVELGEIEAVVRRASGATRSVVLGWPIRDGQPQGLVAFVECTSFDEVATRASIAQDLPEYMLPKKLVAVPDFPNNTNGKIDRRALSELL